MGFPDAQAVRARASAPTAYRFIGASADGQVVFGPVVFPAARTILLTGVPVNVTSLLIEPLAEGKAVDAFVSRSSFRRPHLS